MSINFGPYPMDQPVATASDVKVETWDGSSVELSSPVSVDSLGRVSFAVNSSGRYRIVHNYNGTFYSKKVDIYDGKPYNPTEWRSYVDHVVSKTETESAPAVSVYATPERFPGIDPTGLEDSSDALQEALDAVPDGGSFVLPNGTYLASNLNVSGKSVSFELTGSKFIQNSDSPILRIRGGYESSVPVSSSTTETRSVLGASRNQGRLTLDSVPSSWSVGDSIRIFSDDVIVGARPGSGGKESRRGELGTIFEISGNTIYFSGPLKDEYSQNARASKLLNHTFSINGWHSDTPKDMLSEYTSQHICVEPCINPTLKNIRIDNGGGQGVTFLGGLGGQISGLSIGYLVNDDSGGHFGYGILDNSWQGLSVLSPTIRNVRHAFTDDTLRISAGHSDPGAYGPSRNATIIGGLAFGTSGVAWDTHSAGEGHTFSDCTAIGCDTGFGLRGRRHRVVSGVADGCATGVWVRSDTSSEVSHSHEFINCTVMNARLDAVIISNTVEPATGIVNATISGGTYTSDVRGIRLTRANAIVNSSAKFVCKEGLLPSSTKIILVAHGILFLNGIEIDASKINSGSNLSFISADTSTAVISGKDVTVKSPTGSSQQTNRFSNIFVGLGVFSLRDVDSNYDPSTSVLASTVTAGSRVQYYTPTKPGGDVVTV